MGATGEFGLGRVMLGREEIRRHLIATFGALPDVTIAPTGEPLSSGERVYWKWLMIATHEGEFAGVPATGKRFEVRGASVLLTRGDKVVRCADCFDVGSIVEQVVPGCERRLNSGSRSTPDLWMRTLTDEDNIGYGE
jgi:predicted ester cyclase